MTKGWFATVQCFNQTLVCSFCRPSNKSRITFRGSPAHSEQATVFMAVTMNNEENQPNTNCIYENRNNLPKTGAEEAHTGEVLCANLPKLFLGQCLGICWLWQLEALDSQLLQFLVVLPSQIISQQLHMVVVVVVEVGSSRGGCLDLTCIKIIMTSTFQRKISPPQQR